MARIVIVQPYLPAYRRPLFEGVVEQLRSHGHECVVVTGRLSRKRAARGDSVTAPWHIAFRGFSIKIRGHHIRAYESWREWRRADVLVMELASGSIDTLLALRPRRRQRRRQRVIVWGHVGQQTGAEAGGARSILEWQLRAADSVLAYTPSGQQRAETGGARRAVSLNNTVDTRALAAAMEHQRATSPAPSAASRQRTLAYIGGLDRSKRIDFLAAALDRLWEHDPAIRLLVGGQGADAALLGKAEERGQVTLLGRVGDAEKAALGAEASLLLCPGRVGLVAVESFVLGLPIVTTDWPFHAPEAEYLEFGVDSLQTSDDVASYADTILALTKDPARVDSMRQAAEAKAGSPSLQDMTDLFVEECLRHVLGAGSAPRGSRSGRAVQKTPD